MDLNGMYWKISSQKRCNKCGLKKVQQQYKNSFKLIRCRNITCSEYNKIKREELDTIEELKAQLIKKN